MKLQVCQYKVHKNSPWKMGVACMEVGFGISSVDFILTETGEKIPDCWDYKLHTAYPDSEGFGYSVLDTGRFQILQKFAGD